MFLNKTGLISKYLFIAGALWSHGAKFYFFWFLSPKNTVHLEMDHGFIIFSLKSFRAILKFLNLRSTLTIVLKILLILNIL